MHIVFLSNYLNHHMLPICLSLNDNNSVMFHFVATKEITPYRKSLGYSEYNTAYDFVICSYKSDAEKKKAIEICNSCDVLIYGSAPCEFVKERLKSRKLTFRYSERIYKKVCPWYEIPFRALKYNSRYRKNDNVYLLCASAYTAADYAKLGLFKRKAHKWGYFPEIKKYEDIQSLIAAKKARTLLWAGRLIDWKHPEMALEVASKLKAEGYDFRLDIIGNGDMETLLIDRIATEGLGDCVHMLGSMQPEQVREHMERSEIFLFTSDRQEGWGAVLNESMNSACAVVASHAIGSVPFLIENGRNGLIYKDGNLDDLYQKVKWLLDYSEERKEIAKNAYTTMTEQWNAENAAERFVALSEAILNGDKNPELFSNGVCSTAEKLHDNWF